MADYNTDLKDWGESGEEYPDGYSYNVDEPPVDVWDNYFNFNLVNDIQHLISLTNSRIETDKGSSGNEPASPESAHLYFDEDNDEIEVWDSSKSSWRRLLYSDDSTLRSDSDVVDLIDAEITDAATSVSGLDTAVSNKLEASNYNPVTAVNSETELTVDISGDADTVDGEHASTFADSTHDHTGDSISPDTLNGADLANANSGQVLQSDGDGTLSAGNISAPVDSVNGQTGSVQVDTIGKVASGGVNSMGIAKPQDYTELSGEVDVVTDTNSTTTVTLRIYDSSDNQVYSNTVYSVSESGDKYYGEFYVAWEIEDLYLSFDVYHGKGA